MNGFNIGVSGLKAAQVGLDVTSHNIANVNTANYKRQVVDFAEVAFPDGIASTPDGAGVKVENIRQVTDSFLERVILDSLSKKNEADKYNELMGPISDILDNANLADSFQNVLNSFQDVANNPTNIAIRENALKVSENLVLQSNNLQAALSELSNNLNQQVTNSPTKINSLLDNLKSLFQAQQVTSNNNDSATMASIDTTIYDLAEQVGISVSEDKKNITLSNGKNILQNGIPSYVTASDLSNVSGGVIGGINKFKNEVLNPTIQKLPVVVDGFYNEINNQATQGIDLNNNVGSAIFNNVGGNVSVLSDPNKIGASSTQNPSLNNGDNAQLISDIRYLKVNGQRFTEAFSSIVSDVASKASTSKDLSSMYDNIYNDYKSKLDGLSGVNLDEEGVNLMKYQRMYEANAQVIKTQNEMLGTLLSIKA